MARVNFSHRVNGLFQSASLDHENTGLRPEYARLDYKDDGLNATNQHQRERQPYGPPVGRRVFGAVILVLGGFFLSLRGVDHLDHKRCDLGSALVGLGLVGVAFGYLLCALMGVRSTWGWWV